MDSCTRPMDAGYALMDRVILESQAVEQPKQQPRTVAGILRCLRRQRLWLSGCVADVLTKCGV